MAFAVVAIHTEPLINCLNENITRVYGQVLDLAVPFFFLASGYFLALKMTPDFSSTEDVLRIKCQLSKIVKMYLLWTLIYFPLAAWHFASSRMPLGRAVLLYIRGVFLVGENYNSWPLWYLLSMIYSMAVIIILFKLKKVKEGREKLLVMSIVFSIISVGFTALADYEDTLPFVIAVLQKLIIYSIGNGRIFAGAVYIPVGMLLAKKRIPKYLNYVLFIGCFICNLLVRNSIISGYLGMGASVALFGIIESIDLKDRKIFSILREMSTSIYLIHMYIWSFYYKVIYGEKTYGADSFIVTSVVAAAVSLCMHFGFDAAAKYASGGGGEPQV